MLAIALTVSPDFSKDQNNGRGNSWHMAWFSWIEGKVQINLHFRLPNC